MSQLTFAEAEYQNKKRKTRREIFLEKMDAIIPWKRLENRAAKHVCSCSTTLAIRLWKIRCMKLNQCAALQDCVYQTIFLMKQRF